LPIHEFVADQYVFMVTSQGTVKKTSLESFSRPRQAGIIAVDLEVGDHLVGVDITDGSKHIMLSTASGKAIRFNEDDVRPMGRVAAGVRGIRLAEGDEVISLIVVDEAGLVLTASANGYGKLTEVAEFPVQGRGGQGVISLQTSERNGEVVAAVQVKPEDELMLISSNGTLVRTPVKDISVQGRNTQGVRLIRIDDEARLVGVERIISDGNEAAGEGELAGGDES